MATQVVYWDASAILSVVVRNAHTEGARGWYRQDAVHLISTLALAETCAVLAELERGGTLTDAQAAEAKDVILAPPFQRTSLSPSWDDLRSLSMLHSLRGADLWHLSLARALKSKYFPEIRLLTYDTRLKAAATREDLATTAIG